MYILCMLYWHLNVYNKLDVTTLIDLQLYVCDIPPNIDSQDSRSASIIHHSETIEKSHGSHPICSLTPH